MILKLKGKTRHGKNRVHEQGEHWIIVQTHPNKLLLQQLTNGDNLRWIDLPEDRDFEVVERFDEPPTLEKKE